MSRHLNMNAVMYFEAVARHSRVNLAAEELQVSPSAVSQQIKTLEEQMGVMLFRRVKKRLILTEQGERFYHAASGSIRMIKDAQIRLTNQREYQRLMIRVSASFGVRWLSKRLSHYVQSNPDMDLHIDATSELTDFDKEKVDLEIRYGLAPPPTLYSQSLITDRVLPMCSPEFAQKNQGESPSELLASSSLIHTVKAEVTWRHWLQAKKIADVDDLHGLRFDRSSMSLQAAKDGLGVVLETATLAMEELKSGTLVPLFPDLGTLDFETYWLICPARYLNHTSVKRFVQWIESEANQHESEKQSVLATLGVTGSAPFQPEVISN
ncbi:putative Bacterial regulatory protein, LysR [Vibrio nigripulchritudo SFn27]|uniref:Putative Bacterial regulatory protein, LysR n=1 Tax=Vibrio nigripulchritudo TaxID=28173 RepID=U4JUU9_9VIBR|nr:LysR substrate-binding domain-containing protein [Vibrio nigripulchritudo]CCN83212.1 putative Bacterial regulatory protein, LysR [Vibrio nigripulchritudo BLFn1]CCN88605.1 putative Bacterial regulatory protein, LysR [Vibrio nigripulchritudo SFn27]CCN92744.1 putative Bacterial regulatory protein, LysR [Vibrio nigripulchritudo ENn2]CCO40330.1 putative Bacterial regulatory protein, LysR [Vibrio nigripulchritudo SFn135]CCO52686.1 putative Bacterial regulatory protein, LysR [Vibrio nigripulchritu